MGLLSIIYVRGDRYTLTQYFSESEPVADASDAPGEVAYVHAGCPRPLYVLDQSDTQPAPPVSDDDESGDNESRVVEVYHPLMAPQAVPLPAKPEWWTDAWTKLEGRPRTDGVGGYTQVVSPKEFRAFDLTYIQSIETQDEGQIEPGPHNELIGAIVSVIWDEASVTMTCVGRNDPISHPDSSSESDHIKSSMSEMASALSSMNLSSWEPQVDAEASEKSCHVSHIGALSRRCPIQDAADYWLGPEEAATVSGSPAPRQDGHNVDT
jgi:hypothetical protein